MNRNEPIFNRHKVKPKPVDPQQAEDRMLKAAMAAKIPVDVTLIDGRHVIGTISEIAKFSLVVADIHIMKHAVVSAEAHRA